MLYDALLTSTFLNLIVAPKDLALLKIDPPFEESDKIKPIPINDIHENLDGKEVLISGWGKTTAKTYPNQLQALNITINYGQYSGLITMLNSNAEGACLGDSGGNNAVNYRENIILHISLLLNQIDMIKMFISSNLFRTCCP